MHCRARGRCVIIRRQTVNAPRGHSNPLTSRKALGVKPLESLLPPIERVGVNAQILDRLKIFLDQKHLTIGSRLPSERQLAGLLKVSRPSVREALRALRLFGIIESRQGDGTYLAASAAPLWNLPDQATLEESLDLAELAEARTAIEPIVASLAAQRASEDDLKQIAAHLKGMGESVDDRERFMDHDLQFHLAITRACGNRVLKKMMLIVLETLFKHQETVARHYADLMQILKLHTMIYTSLSRRQPLEARASMARHMKVSKLQTSLLPGRRAPAKRSIAPRRPQS